MVYLLKNKPVDAKPAHKAAARLTGSKRLREIRILSSSILAVWLEMLMQDQTPTTLSLADPVTDSRSRRLY